MTHDSLVTLNPIHWLAKIAVLVGSLKRLAPGNRQFHSRDEQKAFEAQLRGQRARARLGLPL